MNEYIKGRYILPHPPVLIPEVGKEQAKIGIKTLDAFAKIGQIFQEAAPKNVIIISPHTPNFCDKFYINGHARISGDLSQFGHKEVILGFDNNCALGECIANTAKSLGVDAGSVSDTLMRRYGLTYDLDHGIIVPLYFMNHFHNHYKLIPIAISALSPKEHYLMGKAISLAIEEIHEDTVIIASGDLSHKLKKDGPYGFADEGPVFDKTLIDLLEHNNITGILEIDSKLEEKAAQCGLYGFHMLMGTLDGYQMNAKILSYEAPFGIGYMTATIDKGEPSQECPLELYLEHRNCKLNNALGEENILPALAKAALSYFLDTGKEMAVPETIPSEWKETKGGTFVSFKKNGDLRGCIGTIGATQPNYAEEIINNAIAAGTKDFRFSPITPGEIDELTVTIDILSEIETVDSLNDLDPKVYGVIVSSNGKRGLLLPNLEGIDNVEDQIRIAREKAGIPFYKKIKLQRFKVTRYD